MLTILLSRFDRCNLLRLLLNRLWASSGQTALENASVLVVNGSATATQVLKNLVLPGEYLDHDADQNIVELTSTHQALEASPFWMTK